MLLNHRPAILADAQLYFDWANDPLTRQQSFSTTPIVWDNHIAWFSRKLTDPNALLLIFETQQGEPVGQIRFERMPDEVVIGVSIDAAFRGQGLAPQMLRASVDAYRVNHPLPDLPICAYIRPENGASIRSFERAGFKFSHESDKFGVESVVYTVNNEQ